MQWMIGAIGRMKAGPETDLVTRYLDRAKKSGRALGITSVDVREFSESRKGSVGERKQDEAGSLLSALPKGSVIVALDETGKSLTSKQFASLVNQHLQSGTSCLAFVIGGPDGHGTEILENASRTISFGQATWPHQMVRIMLAEQLYRATTILNGHPYHRA